MKKLLEYIEKKAKRRVSFFKSEEYHFFMEYRHYLTKMPKFLFLFDSEGDAFDIMRANIILYGIVNKTLIEQEISNINEYAKESALVKKQIVSTLRERTLDCPYYYDGMIKIFIPFFTKAINLIYLNEPEKLSQFPYNNLINSYSDTMIDPFDTYGASLYNSSFTRLVKVKESDGEVAFFHYDTNTIYMINSQGRLDCKIVLFDKYIHHPSYNHMLERITPVVDAYFNFDKSEFLYQLYQNGFISSRLLSLIRFREHYLK